MKHSRGWVRRRVRKKTGLVGAAVRSVAFLLLIAVCVFGLRWLSGKAHSYTSQWGAQSQGHSFQFTETGSSYGIQSRNRRLVYPYSVIPGGVRSGAELREVASHDPVVGSHYSGFDYTRSHVIQVEQPRMVFVSYRRGGQVHWSRKQVAILKSEMLLTDGHITARTRCGNQVSVLPQANTLPDEPSMAELERPDAVASGREELFPQDSKLFQLDPLVPISPPYAGFPQLGGFMPLPIGGGVGPIGGPCPANKEKPVKPTKKDNCNVPPPPAPVPEPTSLVLVLSGAAAVYARSRQRRA